MPVITGLSEPPADMAGRAANWLARRLACPPLVGSTCLLARLWAETTLTARCHVPAGCRTGPWQTYAIRGAFGDRLFRMGPERHPAPFQPLMRPSLFQIGQRHIPVPLLIECGQEGEMLTITIRLLGFADIWREDAAIALVEALALGISIGENSRISRPYELGDLTWVRQVGNISTAPPCPGGVEIWPHTPICYGAVEHDPATPERFVLSALSRIRGLARWQGVDLHLDMPTLPELCSRLKVECGEARPVESVLKHSRSHPGFEKNLQGERTRLRLRGLSPPETDAVFMASHIGAGGHTSWGFGRYAAMAA